MTKDELMEGRTTTSALNDPQFARALRLATAEVAAETFVKKGRRRGRPAKPREFLSDDADILTGADVAELLSLGG